jgi:hypothetical protein
VDRQTYQSLPEYATIREARFRVEQPEFRKKAIVVVTTLLDPVETTKDDLAALYHARWINDLDLRSIKSTRRPIGAVDKFNHNLPDFRGGDSSGRILCNVGVVQPD